MIDALQKLAHDAALRSCGAEPRFFPRASLPDGLDLAAAARWHQSLLRVVRHADHPWNEGLLAEALVSEGAQVWQGARATTQTARAMPRADTLSARLPSS
jgi:DNA polymerase-3 subunit delta'